MSNKTYDTLKLIALVYLPMCTFIATTLTIWKVPYADQITATMVAVDTLLGTLVKVLGDNYQKKKAEELEQAKAINQQEGK